MQPFKCQTCDLEVLVEKFSTAHTSIQWPADITRCRWIGDGGRARGDEPGCRELRAGIDQAALAHLLPETEIDIPVGDSIPRL